MKQTTSNNTKLLMTLQLVSTCFGFAASEASALDLYAPARFVSPDRIEKLQKAFPTVDEIFCRYAADKHIPGMVWGVSSTANWRIWVRLAYRI